MKREVDIYHTSFEELGIGTKLQISGLAKYRMMFGELCHESNFVNPNNSEIVYPPNVAFKSTIINTNKLSIETNDSIKGKFLSDLLDQKSEHVKFVPRVLISNADPHNAKLTIVSFDAVINNKELWESI